MISATWTANGRLVLCGRVSALVNVAGRKVDPAEVERRLLDLPGIADARVLGMSCDTRGQQVVAFLVRTDAALTPLAIRQRCAETLSTHKIPRRYIFVDRFPVDARGKIDRRALERLVSTDDQKSSASDHPETIADPTSRDVSAISHTFFDSLWRKARLERPHGFQLWPIVSSSQFLPFCAGWQ